MAMMRDLIQAQITFQVTGMQVDDFDVVRYRGTEGLCQLYRFEIELATSLESVNFDDIVGKAAALSINTDYGTRFFHGIVGRFEMTGEQEDRTYFRAELVPHPRPDALTVVDPLRPLVCVPPVPQAPELTGERPADLVGGQIGRDVARIVVLRVEVSTGDPRSKVHQEFGDEPLFVDGGVGTEVTVPALSISEHR